MENQPQAIWQHEINQRLISRLELIKIQPKKILIIASADILAEQFFSIKFPQAKIILAFANDLALNNDHFDLIYANLVLPGLANIADFFQKIYQMLNQNGLFLFSSLGVESFLQLQSVLKISENLLDMHEIGDCLQQLNFEDIVMDMENLQVKYKNFADFKLDLNQTGFDAWFDWLKLPDILDQFILNLEIIYGHAWRFKKIGSYLNAEGEAVFDIENLKKLL